MSHNRASERLVWSVDALDVKPADRLLEIGCGHGVAVSLVCEKLNGGHITAVDRSSKMIAMALKRNAMHVAAGKASFQAVSLAEADFGSSRFDKVFAIRVGVFLRGNPAMELDVIKRCLRGDGRFYLIYDPFEASQAPDVIEQASDLLKNHGFNVQNVLTKDIAQTRVICVIGSKE